MWIAKPPGCSLAGQIKAVQPYAQHSAIKQRCHLPIPGFATCCILESNPLWLGGRTSLHCHCRLRWWNGFTGARMKRARTNVASYRPQVASIGAIQAGHRGFMLTGSFLPYPARQIHAFPTFFTPLIWSSAFDSSGLREADYVFLISGTPQY
jgi:hypothetical protein